MRSASLLLLMASAAGSAAAAPPPVHLLPLQVAANRHYLQTSDGKPFFWLADTGWLLLERLDRAQTERYFAKRSAQGFDVIQVMVLHSPDAADAAGTPALRKGSALVPLTTPGNDPARPGQYDYWDHLDWVIDCAARHGLYLALVPAWGSLADSGKLDPASAAAYGRFLGQRYRRHVNIVWINGGDTHADQHTATWTALGEALKAADPGHLVTFHPFGRTDSSWTFNAAPWLDFNMFQSGHRSYAQDDKPGARGEDNWRYVAEDWQRKPIKPTVDGEPSYENIPHGLHDVSQPRWQAADVRRYAWWSVFAGAMGHTYGDNDVMQMYVPGRDKPAYGADTPLYRAIDAPGATQMRYLKRLMLSRPYFDRVPDQGLIVDNGTRYDRVLATRGASYAMAYTYNGRPFGMKLGVISGKAVRAEWYDPRTGKTRPIGTFPNHGVKRFDPPGTTRDGNDWALLLDDASTHRTP